MSDTETCDDGKVDNCGACNATCTGAGTGQAHTVCYPGCNKSTTADGFQGGMVGCANNITYAARNSYCATGYQACTAGQWDKLHGGAAPSYHYWTNDALNYDDGPSFSCVVTTKAATNMCLNAPAHVCKDAKSGVSVDALGNTCTNYGCGFGTKLENDHMGGCDDATAGALCCPTQTCADGSVEQAFGDGMIGCAGKVTFDQRAALCPVGSFVCTAAQWVAKRGGANPVPSLLDRRRAEVQRYAQPRARCR